MSAQTTSSGSDFVATPSVNGDEVTLTLTGTGDMAAVAPLEQCLNQMHQLITARGFGGARIDISALYLLNSSCIKTLLSFLHTNMRSKRRYPVRFIVDAHLAWQARTLGVLARMAPDLVSVTPKQ